MYAYRQLTRESKENYSWPAKQKENENTLI